MTANRMSRREALALLGGAASIGVLAACSAPAPVQPTTVAPPKIATAPVATTEAGATRPVNVAVRATRSPNYALWLETGSVLSTMPYIAMGLALQNASGGMEPWLASSFDVDASGSTLTVKLRPEATWSDGQPVTADDLV